MLLFVTLLPLIFHMAAAGNGHLLIIMTSNSSGYLTVKNNISSFESAYLRKAIPIPLGARAFVRYTETAPHIVGITVGLGRFQWNRGISIMSDFLGVFQGRPIAIRVRSKSCIKTDCFKLFFSFFQAGSWPEKLPSGLWNCSASYYPSIHPHLACNHLSECEDGRDETEHCSFSSPECQGLMAICNRCYQFVMVSRAPKDLLEGSKKHCRSLGAKISFPKCACDSVYAQLAKTKLHPKRFSDIFTGFYSNDMSLLPMYRHVMLNEKTVVYHSFALGNKGLLHHWGQKLCYALIDKVLAYDPCANLGAMNVKGVSCELKVNRTEEGSPHSQTPPFPSRDFPLSSGQHSMTVCAGGHVTFTFFLLGSNQYKVCPLEQTSFHKDQYSASDHSITFPTFQCSNGITLSYTLVCNFVPDCQDKSDESVCKYPACPGSFTCDNGQCLSIDNVCDQIPHCYDETDELNCEHFQGILFQPVLVQFPALVKFDSVRQFTSTPLHPNESCPDSHFRCPGDFNDCLPVYTRCNGMHDCLDHQDEEGCEDLRCPGFFRCRVSTVCLHDDQLCDGWAHCPLGDDELVCDLTCPVGCVCQGHTFRCFQPFSATQFPQLRYLDATESGMTLSDVHNHDHLFYLILARCSLTLLPQVTMCNLRILDLSDNQLQHFNVTSISGLGSLHSLTLAKNPLSSILSGDLADFKQRTLQVINLSRTSVMVFDAMGFSPFTTLQKLDLTCTAIHTISPGGFQSMQHLAELYLQGSPVQRFPPDLFKDLRHLHTIVTDNYKLCCDEVLSYNIDSASCHAPKSDISSCKDLLLSWTYRGFLWLIGSLSVTGNAFCFCARFFAKSSSVSGFSVFVTNLTLADFLMGVYCIIIGITDEQYRGAYLHHDDSWKSSNACKLAGVLSLLSSEVSGLIIWIITLDRFVVLHFPFSRVRFDRVSAAVACLFIWLFGLLLALVPLLPVASHWNFYGQTGICIPLPVTTQDFKGRWYTFSIMVAFNLVLFLCISAGQALIYWSIQHNTLKTNTTIVSRDMTIARRLITIAVTDFMCWFPIGLCGLLAVAGTAIPGEINVALAIFVLPFNSAVNPFMYTFNTLAEKRRKTKEAKLCAWLEAHAESITI